MVLDVLPAAEDGGGSKFETGINIGADIDKPDCVPIWGGKHTEKLEDTGDDGIVEATEDIGMRTADVT